MSPFLVQYRLLTRPGALGDYKLLVFLNSQVGFTPAEIDDVKHWAAELTKDGFGHYLAFREDAQALLVKAMLQARAVSHEASVWTAHTDAQIQATPCSVVPLAIELLRAGVFEPAV